MKTKSEIFESEIGAKKSKKENSKKDAKKNSEKEKHGKNSSDNKKKKSKERSMKKSKKKESEILERENGAKKDSKSFVSPAEAKKRRNGVSDEKNTSASLVLSADKLKMANENFSKENEISASENSNPILQNSRSLRDHEFSCENPRNCGDDIALNSQFADEIISLENVRRVYTMGETQVQALRGISFKINQGEFVAIMGPSGSGKSTCMNMIGCLDRPSEGVVRVGGRETALMNEKELSILRNRTIGFVFQQYFLLPSMSVLENVMLPLRYYGIERKERVALAKSALEKMGLQDRMNHRPSELSGGQKQRVAIARATVTNPKIILADEPTGALDSETGRAVMNLFREINLGGTTVVIVTHDPRIGEASRRCIKIFDGKIQSDEMQDGERICEE